jgi:DNA-binding transcriptional MerR regulator
VSRSSPRWTIVELGRKVAEALAVVDYEGPANGQVRAIPNQRSIRYYTTLGLLDRPVEMHGRTALYGPQHLRQLVAIKRLQARGHSLAEVQEALAGASRRKLAAIAQVPDWIMDTGAGPGPGSGDHVEQAPPSPRAQSFWAVQPSEHTEAEPAAEPDATAPADDDSDAVVLASVSLGHGVTLLVSPARPLDRDDVTAIRRAAQALMSELAGRGICPAPGSQSQPGSSQPPTDDRDTQQGEDHGASNRSHEQR